jgi:hypothetical protein
MLLFGGSLGGRLFYLPGKPGLLKERDDTLVRESPVEFSVADRYCLQFYSLEIGFSKKRTVVGLFVFLLFKKLHFSEFLKESHLIKIY